MVDDYRKQHFLETAWLLHTETHSSCDSMYKSYSRTSIERGGEREFPLLAEELLVLDCFWEGGSQFSLRMCCGLGRWNALQEMDTRQ